MSSLAAAKLETLIVSKKSGAFIQRFFHVTCSKALYNDQFTPSGPEAYLGASGIHFKAVHVCWYSFYRPRKDGKLREF